MELLSHLEKIVSLLTSVKLDQMHKIAPRETNEFVEFRIELVQVGVNLFNQFFELGCQAHRDGVTSFKDLNDSRVQISGQLIVEVENWMYQFLSGYPFLRINIDEHSFIDNTVFEIRSGFQFMLDFVQRRGLEIGLDSRKPDGRNLRNI
jgi:hypothetical protein